MTQEILVVDDSRTVRTVVEWVFHGSPYTVRAVSTASDAIRAARERTPTAMLVDYSLPDQSGFELCQEFRRDPALRSIPLLMLGGTWGGFDENRVAACGADDFIYKPFKTDALIEKVMSVVSRASARPVVLTPAGATPAVSEPAVPEPITAETAPASPPSRPVRPVPPLPGAPAPPKRPTPLPSPTSTTSGSGFRRVSDAPATPPAAMPPAAVAPAPSAATPPAVEAAPFRPPAAETAPVGPPPIPVAPQRDSQPTPVAAEEAATTQPALEEAPIALTSPAADDAISRAGDVTADIPNPVAQAAAPPEVDPEALEEVVRQLLPPIVKEVLAALLRQTIGARVESYATTKINAFVDSELPAMAQAAIAAKLAERDDL